MLGSQFVNFLVRFLFSVFNLKVVGVVHLQISILTWMTNSVVCARSPGVLIATDVASRGIDIPGVALVVHSAALSRGK